MNRYDVIVVGGGAAGLSAARTANWEGASVALVNDGPLGGDCTFTGCVPSKTLIEASQRGAGFDEAMAAVADVVERIASSENADVLRAEGVAVVEGKGTFDGTGRLLVDGEVLLADRFVIATGGAAALPPVPGLVDVQPHTNESIFSMSTPPASLVVLGGGPIGSELAQAFARLGVDVTIVELAERILIKEEPEASAVVLDTLRADGVDVRLGQLVRSVHRGDRTVVLTTPTGTIEAEELLVAAGRRPLSGGLGLESVGVAVDARGYVETDAKLATTGDGIWAAGDITGRLPFTHAADEMGRLAAWQAVGARWKWRFDASSIPWVTFTSPEVARVGIAEADAPGDARVAYLPMAENDRAITAGRLEGFVKLIAGPRRVLRNVGGGRILGATIVAPRAGEMIHEASLAMRTRMFTGRLAQAPHAYPTWSAGIQKAAAQFFYEIEGRSARPPRDWEGSARMPGSGPS